MEKNQMEMGALKSPEQEKEATPKKYEDVINGVKAIFEQKEDGLESCAGCLPESEKLAQLLSEKMTKEELVVLEHFLGREYHESIMTPRGGSVSCGEISARLIIDAIERMEKRLASERYNKFRSIRDVVDNEK